MRQSITKNKVSSSTEREDDEEDGAQTQVPHGTGIWTSTGALHPDLQGLHSAEALLPDERGGLIRITVVMHDCQWLLVISCDRRERGRRLAVRSSHRCDEANRDMNYM